MIDKERLLQDTAEREKDALVAEKVLGIRVVRDTFTLNNTDTRIIVGLWDGDKDDEDANPIPHYSTLDASARELLNALYDQGWFYKVTRYTRWRVELWRPGMMRPPFDAEADTFPAATCDVALKAVGALS